MSKFSYAARFPALFAQINAGGKPVCFFDQDGTVTTNLEENGYNLCLHEDLLPAVREIIAKGGIYIPSSARSMADLKNCYATIPYLPIAANDGYVLSMPTKSTDIVYNGRLPYYETFKEKLSQFMGGILDASSKELGAYFGLMIDIAHPGRFACEEFFAENIESVSALSGGMEMTLVTHTNGITMEPVYNRGKAGVIDAMLPLLNIEDPILIVAGDGDTDIGALSLAKRRGGHAFKVHDGSMPGIPQYATGELFDSHDCVGLLKAIAKAMK